MLDVMRVLEKLDTQTESAKAREWIGLMRGVIVATNLPYIEAPDHYRSPAPPLRRETRDFHPHENSDDKQLNAPGVANVFLEAAENDLRETRKDIRLRVDRLFYATVALGLLTAIVLLVGATLAIFGNIAAGALSGASSILGGVISGTLGKMYVRENSHLHEIANDLKVFEYIRLGLWAADRIKNRDIRDAAVARLIESMPQEPPRKDAETDVDSQDNHTATAGALDQSTSQG